jgi:hypothetical protein
MPKTSREAWNVVQHHASRVTRHGRPYHNMQCPFEGLLRSIARSWVSRLHARGSAALRLFRAPTTPRRNRSRLYELRRRTRFTVIISTLVQNSRPSMRPKFSTAKCLASELCASPGSICARGSSIICGSAVELPEPCSRLGGSCAQGDAGSVVSLLIRISFIPRVSPIVASRYCISPSGLLCWSQTSESAQSFLSVGSQPSPST